MSLDLMLCHHAVPSKKVIAGVVVEVDQETHALIAHILRQEVPPKTLILQEFNRRFVAALDHNS